jgi:hypothetical protein
MTQCRAISYAVEFWIIVTELACSHSHETYKVPAAGAGPGRSEMMAAL